MKKRKPLFVLCILLLVILIAVVVIVFLHEKERNTLQYESIEKITFTNGYPPFTEYELSNAEINEFVACLSGMDFTTYPQLINDGEGCGTECEIVADGKTYSLMFLKPCLWVEGVLYELESNAEIFRIEKKIVEKRMSK